MLDEATTDDLKRRKPKTENQSIHSQLDNDGPWLDLVHFHKGKTFCAGKLLLRFVVLEFKEDSCSWKNAHASYSQDGGCELQG